MLSASLNKTFPSFPSKIVEHSGAVFSIVGLGRLHIYIYSVAEHRGEARGRHLYRVGTFTGSAISYADVFLLHHIFFNLGGNAPPPMLRHCAYVHFVRKYLLRLFVLLLLLLLQLLSLLIILITTTAILMIMMMIFSHFFYIQVVYQQNNVIRTFARTIMALPLLPSQLIQSISVMVESLVPPNGENGRIY